VRAQQSIDDIAGFLQDHRRLFVLTGAGISMGSGIPTYRDDKGDWTRSTPVQFRDFVNRHAVRQRYWARSMVGWPAFARARPNLCHTTLTAWERNGRIVQLVTQNVDRLHQAAGSRCVIDLHGRLDQVVCLDCRRRSPRADLQAELQRLNPEFADLAATVAPDGDADLDGTTFGSVKVPGCTACGGLLKPDVVFFGETVPKPTVDAALAALTGADAVLVIGSSLMVYSGFRFCRLAAEADMPIAAISPGRTRADDLLTLKVEARFESVITGLAEAGFSLDQPDGPRQSSR
jgi:NAD-dependent SIR2 family protein deacetylase